MFLGCCFFYFTHQMSRGGKRCYYNLQITIYKLVRMQVDLLRLPTPSLCRYPFPTVFSSCSKKDLLVSLDKGVGMCLFNMPEVKVLYGGQKCGNGYVEEGEECDCGDLEVCQFMINVLYIMMFLLFSNWGQFQYIHYWGIC